MTRRISQLIVSTLIVTAFILLLHTVSRKLLEQDNSFVRIFPPHRIGAYRNLELTFNSYYLAGLDAQFIYAGNGSNPFLLTKAGYSLFESNVLFFQLPFSADSIPLGLQWVIRSQMAWLADYISGDVIIGNVVSKRSFSLATRGKFRFSDILPLSTNTVVFNFNDTSIRQRVLVKAYQTDTGFQYADRFVPDQREEGWFSTSGGLCYDSTTQSVVYVSHYSNRVFCLDTNLHIKYKSRTIDTTNEGHLNLIKVPSSGMQSPDRPDQLVNPSCAASAGWLFVHSRLRATNENAGSFGRNAVIDVYSLKDGHYHYSFYIPAKDGKMIKSFLVNYPYVVVLYERSLAVFELFPSH